MAEWPPNTPERHREHIPDEVEVFELFERFLQGKPCTEKEKISDEQGLLLWTLGFIAEDGDPAEITYTRAGRYLSKDGREEEHYTAIRVVYFDSTGRIEMGGTSLARWDKDNERWTEGRIIS